MKKKHREITVNGVEYAWTLKEGDEYNKINIWRDKKVIHEELLAAYQEVGPRIIKEMIEDLLAEEEEEEVEPKREVLLWLDDYRNPFELKKNWLRFYAPRWVYNLDDVVWVKNYDAFTKWITNNGLPHQIAFDHDLAVEHYAPSEVYEAEEYDKWEKTKDFEEKTGMDAAKWLVEYCMDNNLKLPMFVVQSANPNGAKNIREYLTSFLLQNK